MTKKTETKKTENYSMEEKELQKFLLDNYLYLGELDGILGYLSEKAIKRFQLVNGLNVDGIAGNETIKKIKSGEYETLPTEDQVEDFYGEAGSSRNVFVRVPYPLQISYMKDHKINKFGCHELVKGRLEKIFKEILDVYGLKRIESFRLDQFGGCFNYRNKRNGKGLSMHSWGIAIDIDPDNNGLGVSERDARLSRPEYEDFWKIVEKHGGVSLGRNGYADWMHFQFVRVSKKKWA